MFIPICIIKEIYRAKKILGGITTAAQMFPEQELVLVVIGLVKGAGSNLMRPVTRLVCGVWSPGSTEVLAMSTTCKATLVAATLMVVERNGSGYDLNIVFDITRFVTGTCCVYPVTSCTC